MNEYIVVRDHERCMALAAELDIEYRLDASGATLARASKCNDRDWEVYQTPNTVAEALAFLEGYRAGLGIGTGEEMLLEGEA